MEHDQYASDPAARPDGRPSPTGRPAPTEEDGSALNPATMAVGLIPWVLFSVMTHRLGASAVGFAALAAAALGLVLLLRKRASPSGPKLIEVTGVITFSLLAILGFVGGSSLQAWIADFGRAGAAFVLAVVMLVSVFFVPFSEQYARDAVPRQYWDSPAFRAVNRRISAAWGSAILVMAAGHVVAGVVDPTTAPRPGARPVDLALNWGLPILLILLTLNYTKRVSGAADGRDLGASPR